MLIDTSLFLDRKIVPNVSADLSIGDLTTVDELCCIKRALFHGWKYDVECSILLDHIDDVREIMAKNKLI